MQIVRYTYPNRLSSAVPFGLAARSPWNGLENEIDRLFETALSGLSSLAGPDQFPVDLYEDKEHTYVRAELPGINRDDLNVEMVNGYLTISGSRKVGEAEGKQEEAFSFSRSVSIPEEIQADKVTAAYENGVLTVTLPKREEVKPKKITVNVK